MRDETCCFADGLSLTPSPPQPCSAVWSGHPGIKILGSDTCVRRAPIITFLVAASGGAAPAGLCTEEGAPGTTALPNLFLHYSFVSALLNDLFGIQGRGGCLCSGPCEY